VNAPRPETTVEAQTTAVAQTMAVNQTTVAIMAIQAHRKTT